MHGRILVKLLKITHHQVHATRLHYQGHGVKSQGDRQHFPKMHFSMKAYTAAVYRGRRFSVENHLV